MRKSVLSCRISEYQHTQIWKYFEKVCKVYGQDADFAYLQNGTRKREFVEIRHMTMLIVKDKHPKYSLESIGAFFEKDHATIIHGIKTAGDLFSTDKNFRKAVQSILEPY